ncbi:MAG: TlpA family protein disulfide reductase [Verrucomicrobiaceae bacterium]|nr:TlpA family protein disulfide reductase [Verrucomicrobiaceae bacterium]
MKKAAQRWWSEMNGSCATCVIYVCLALLCANARADVVNILRNLLGGGDKPAEATTPANASPSRLRWNNGESIPGEILDGNAVAVRWKTTLFADPLEVSWHVLRRIDQTLPAVEVKEPFSFVLRDGSHLCGDVVEITDKTITLRSARHGDATVKRSEVLSMRRLGGGDLVAAGPTGDAGWSVLTESGSRRSSPDPGSNSSVPTLLGGPGGALSLPYWNRGASLKAKLPEMIDAEFRVRSSQRPDFKFGLAYLASTMRQLAIETWDDELVLTTGDGFKVIRKIAGDERAIALRVCWDVKAAKCSVFTPAGELLAEWQPPEEIAAAAAGVNVQNKGRDLALEFLLVRKWNGKPPSKVDEKLPRLELTTGEIFAGEVTHGSAGTFRVRAPGESAEREVKLAEVDAMFFSNDEAKISPHEVLLSYADGTRIAGKIDSIKDGEVAMRTSFADAPVKSKLDALRQIFIEVPSPDGKPPVLNIVDMDNLKFAPASLHGKLVADGGSQPKWLAIGGVKPASVKSGDSFEITRAFPAGTETPTAPALFFTNAGDILPGDLRGIDRSGVEMISEIMDGKRIPADALNAVQFGATSRLNLADFGDPGWQIVKGGKDGGGVKREGDSVALEPDTAIGHVAAMQCSEIKFSMAYGGMSTVRLRLFCAGLDGERATSVMISHWGSHIYSGMEMNENQLADQQRTIVPSGKPVNVRIVVKEKTIELNMNGALVQTIQVPVAKRLGSGLVIEPAGLWGNTVNAVSLTHFSAHSAPGMTWLPSVNAETKMHALTVPRFRKEDLAHHALIASNGDVLRGEIDAATATHFGFRSGLETFRVPRDRVKAAIWLKKPLADGQVVTVEASPTQKLLEQRIQRNMRYSNAELRSLVGVLEREASGLRFVLPAKEDSRRFPFQFGGQTVGEALDQICALFGLRHHADKDGKIVLEEAPAVPKGLVQTSRWLKADAFTDKASPKEVLDAKGVPFPNGASAMWDAAAHQLTVTNTPENQAKLDEVLAKEFGGSLGSPTHWLLLANGARLGLTVDKFEAAKITGHHPVYGACHVPMKQVYTIRTSKPEPTTTMGALADWRLVYAPDPVLPETGGESSPMLGKPAPVFKLPLLGGGDFDLAQEKGKVVVLDFWATWCGPCIKSMPGVIEAMSQFPSDKVKLVGANQGEGGDVVKRFLEARNLKLAVAMDGTQSVARQYGVEGIPHTVIIGPDGNVAWVKTGYSPEGHTEAANAVKELLAKQK